MSTTNNTGYSSRIAELEAENARLREELAPYHQDGADRINAVLAQIPYAAMAKRLQEVEQDNARLRQTLNAISENIPQEEFDAYVRLAEEVKG